MDCQCDVTQHGSIIRIVTKLTCYVGPSMNMNPRQNQIDMINGFGFDLIRKIEGSVSYEQVLVGS